MRGHRAVIGLLAALCLFLGISQAPAYATGHTTAQQTWAGEITIYTTATYDTVNGTDKLKCVHVWTNGTATWVRVTINEATIGQENWITTSDLTIARTGNSTTCTTGSPYRSPGGKVSIAVWTTTSHRVLSGAWNYNS
jgi:hypothetical protein